MSTELIKRGALTLGALLVYWIGLHIPLPGIDMRAWMAIFDMQSGGMLGQANALSGGGVRTLSILSLSITPYVSAALILQMLAMVSRRLRALADGARGRARLERYTIAGAVLLAAMQAYGVAISLERVGPVVAEPGFMFRVTTMLTLMAGTLFVVWLAGQITARGIGNGIVLIIAAGIVNTLPREIAVLIIGSQQGIIAPGALAVIVVITVAVAALVVVVERSRRRIPVEFAARQAGAEHQAADIVLKLNPAGLMPSYLTSVLLTVVLTAGMFLALRIGEGDWPRRLQLALGLGTTLHLVVTAVLTVVFTLLYTAFVCDPEQMAARLTVHGGTLPGVAPGEATAAHLDAVISRTAIVGAVYLTVVMLLPEFLTGFFQLPVVLGGTSILVLVCVVLDLAAEIRIYLTPAR